MPNNAQNREIIIDLLESTNPGRLKEENLIQRRAWDEVHEKIKQFADKATNEKENQDTRISYSRSHSTIAVFGRRGEGKSTFILNVLEEYLNPTIEKRKNLGVWSIGIIDPTLMENGEHPLIYVISEIHKQVINFHEATRNQTSVPKTFEKWEASLRKLARGLKTLDGVGNNQFKEDCWEDEHFILEEGLKNSTSGQHLEQEFNIFLKCSLEFLNKKMFLLAFDDVDTDFSKGWEVLEVIRKYLTSKHLLVILSGDLELYSSLIRKKQWAMFEDLPERDDDKDYYNKTVRALEGQYLLKILRNENRVQLRPLSDYLSQRNIQDQHRSKLSSSAAEVPNDKYIIKIRTSAKESKELTEFLCENLEKRHFIKSIHDLQRYKELICSLPARTVLQILLCMSNDRKKDDSDYFINLGTIFLSTLSSFKIRPDEISNYNGRVNFDLLAMILTKNSLWNNGYKLKIDHSDSEINYLHFVLGGLFSYHLSEEPASVFDYFVKIGLTRWLLNLNPEIEKDKETAPKKIQDYISFLQINTGQTSLHVARRALGILRDTRQGESDDPSLYFGTIRVFNDTYKKTKISGRLAKESDLERLQSDNTIPNASAFYAKVPKEGEYFGRILNTVETLTSRIDEKNACFINMITSRVIDRKGENRTILSLFGLLGLISRILTAPDKSSLVTRLRHDSEIKTIPSFTLGSYSREQKQGELEEYELKSPDDSEKITKEDPLIEAIYIWASQQIPFKAIPVFTLGRIWDRLSFVLERISEENSSKKWLSGYLMHRFCVAFLHAVLTEYLLYMNENPSLKNPVSNDAEFEKNLAIWNHSTSERKDTVESDLFGWIWSCPIWGVFIDPSSPVFKNYIMHLKTNNPQISHDIKDIFLVTYYFKDNESVKYNNLYNPLNSLAIVASAYFEVKNKDNLKDIEIIHLSRIETRFKLKKLTMEMQSELADDASKKNAVYKKFSRDVFRIQDYNQALILSKYDSVCSFFIHYEFLLRTLKSINFIETVEFMSYLASMVKKPTGYPKPIGEKNLRKFYDRYLESK